jgi:hypothetical protein
MGGGGQSIAVCLQYLILILRLALRELGRTRLRKTIPIAVETAKLLSFLAVATAELPNLRPVFPIHSRQRVCWRYNIPTSLASAILTDVNTGAIAGWLTIKH